MEKGCKPHISIIDRSVEAPRQLGTTALTRVIRDQCDRAVRLVNWLISERDDVLLEYTRLYARRSA